MKSSSKGDPHQSIRGPNRAPEAPAREPSLKTSGRRRLYGAAVVLLAIAMVLFILPRWMTLNRLIPFFSQAFSQATGRTLSIGTIRLSFWSGPEIRFQNVRISEKGEVRPFATISEARLGFQIPPLLWKKIVVRRIHLTAPSVSITRDRAGIWNFEDLIYGAGGGPWKVVASSGDLTFTNGALSYTDRYPASGPVEWRGEGIEGEIHRPWVGGETRLRLAIASLREAKSDKGASLSVRGVITAEGAPIFKTGKTRLFASLSRFDAEMLRPYLSPDVPHLFFESLTFSLQADNADMAGIEKLFGSPALELTGESRGVRVDLAREIPPIEIEEARWIYRRLDGRFTLRRVHLRNSTLQSVSGGVTRPFSGGALNLETAGLLRLPDLAEFLASRFQSDRLKRLQPQGTLDVAIQAKIPLKRPVERPGAEHLIDLKGRLRLRDGELTPFSSMKPIQKIKAEARLDRDQLVVESAEGEWGGAPFKLTGRVPNLSRAGVEFDFHAPFVDLDALFLEAPRPAPPAPARASSSKPASPKNENLYAVGLVQIDDFKIKSYHLTKFKSAVTYQEGAVQLRETEAQVEEGAFKANFAQAYFRDDGSVSLAITPALSEVNFETALKDFYQSEDQANERPFMSGKLLAMGGLNTEGKNFEEFKRNLRGNLVVYFENGTIRRFKTLARIFSLMNIKHLPDLKLKGLPYRAISSKLTIEKGAVTLHEAVMFGRDVRMIAKGKVDLANDRLDLETGVQVFKAIDELLREIPLVGYLLLGEDKMFIASYFDVKGSMEDPIVRFQPLKTIQRSILNVLKRAITFPEKPRLFVK